MIARTRLFVGFGPAPYDIDVPMKIQSHAIGISSLILLAACSEEPPPVSVSEFMENPRLLEATMVRCAQNRAETKYEAACVNAREAINRIEAAEEKVRRQELEKQSERKRKALRRTQEAAAAARRRTLEERRRREEEEYLGLFDQSAPDAAQPSTTSDAAGGSVPVPAGNAPTVDLSPPPEAVEPQPEAAEPAPEVGTDLSAIREELKRRQEPPED